VEATALAMAGLRAILRNRLRPPPARGIVEATRVTRGRAGRRPAAAAAAAATRALSDEAEPTAHAPFGCSLYNHC
jgi:hypothetical protein